MRRSQDVWVCTKVKESIEMLRRHEYGIVNKRYGKEYVDVTCTLDIETSANEEDGYAYTFQMCVDGQCILYRYIEDFIEFIEQLVLELGLGRDRRMVFYIHNLGFEHVFMTQIIGEKWGIDDSLLTKPKKPLYIRFSNGIEFRDSLKLFQKSLARATKGLPHEKLKGDLDYSIWRTPDTPLSPDEWNYCINDVLGLYEAIERLKTEHGYNQATIPLTNTAMVIEAVNKVIRKDGKTFQAMQALALEPEDLKLAFKCMAGGDTHGTRWRSGRTFANCNSYDFKSAHPSQQLLRPFPSGKPMRLKPDTPIETLEMLIEEGYGWLGRVIITDFQLRPECPNPIISVSKCGEIIGKTGVDNGRLMGADVADVYMDSNDWQRFREGYEYGDAVGAEIIMFELRPLPARFREAIRGFFEIKENAEDGPERNFAKVCVNTIFGACAQKVIRDEFTLSLDDFLSPDKIGWEANIDGMDEGKVYKKQVKKFPFLWGLWTASCTRLELWKMQKLIGWENVIYWDTDSVKYEGPKSAAIIAYNDGIKELCRKAGAVVVNRKGKEVYIGAAEDEHPSVEYGYNKFRFLHAKCYAAETWNGDSYELESTIAGVGKKEGVIGLKGDIENLAVNLYIPNAGGLSLTYYERPVTDRKEFKRPTKTASYIAMADRFYLVRGSNIDMILPELDCEIMA